MSLAVYSYLNCSFLHLYLQFSVAVTWYRVCGTCYGYIRGPHNFLRCFFSTASLYSLVRYCQNDVVVISLNEKITISYQRSFFRKQIKVTVTW